MASSYFTPLATPSLPTLTIVNVLAAESTSYLMTSSLRMLGIPAKGQTYVNAASVVHPPVACQTYGSRWTLMLKLKFRYRPVLLGSWAWRANAPAGIHASSS